MLKDYAEFLNKWIKADLTDNQKKLFNSLKLAAMPKNDEESRVIMMLGIHSKMFFSLFAESKLKRGLKGEAKASIWLEVGRSRGNDTYFSADKGAKSRL